MVLNDPFIANHSAGGESYLPFAKACCPANAAPEAAFATDKSDWIMELKYQLVAYLHRRQHTGQHSQLGTFADCRQANERERHGQCASGIACVCRTMCMTEEAS